MNVRKDCPFCGGFGLVEQVKAGLAIVCETCGTIGPARKHGADAERAWNTRPPFAGLPRIPDLIRRDPHER